RLTGEDIVHYIHTEFGVHYHLNHVYKILKQLGFSWITSRSKHPKQSLQSQEAFKKLPAGNDPSHSRSSPSGSR
ncbi:MAG: winged helix-turn-helix domain-containing protein, partial [Oceanicoccus sp.]|nr:winged helix-turn-helix domain-containing protein [Oceanicoccus sp.]